ncbi:MAG TPA: hypothetical protein VK158_02085 [Acidobacteriota bacterium]|nr:hypothetical protein [Acidobacteriota bacterium]
MSGIFTDGVYTLERLGVVDVILPFVLIFTIVFGIFSKINLWGDAKNAKQFNVMIALAMGLIVVFQHVINRGSPYDVVDIINNSLPQVAIILVAIVMLFLMVGLFDGQDQVKSWKGWVAGISVVVVLFIFASNAGFGWWTLPYWINEDLVTLIVVLMVFGGIIYYITKPESSP